MTEGYGSVLAHFRDDPAGEVAIRPATKHGTVLRPARDEWERLAAFA